jgi:hypothetical protein
MVIVELYRWNEDWQGKPKYSEKKPTPVPLPPPQISHDLNQNRTRAATVGSQRLTTWDMARPSLLFIQSLPHNEKSVIPYTAFGPWPSLILILNFTLIDKQIFLTVFISNPPFEQTHYKATETGTNYGTGAGGTLQQGTGESLGSCSAMWQSYSAYQFK